MEGKKRGIKNPGKRKLYTILMIVSLVVFCFCLVQLFLIFLDYRKGADSYRSVERLAVGGDGNSPLIQPAKEESEAGNEASLAPAEDETGESQPAVLRYQFNGDTQALYEQNPDFIGWIYIPGTAVSYPMVQAEDNDYYLRRTFEGVDNNAGSIFMDFRIKSGLDARNPIIYGHNRKDGSMFATLKRYQKKTFFDKYRYIYIFTTEGDRIYEVFSVYVTEPASDTYTYGFGSEESFLNYIEKVKGRSMYDTGVEVAAGDSIITLSTCATAQGDTRFVVQAKRIR